MILDESDENEQEDTSNNTLKALDLIYLNFNDFLLEKLNSDEISVLRNLIKKEIEYKSN